MCGFLDDFLRSNKKIESKPDFVIYAVTDGKHTGLRFTSYMIDSHWGGTM